MYTPIKTIALLPITAALIADLSGTAGAAALSGQQRWMDTVVSVSKA